MKTKRTSVFAVSALFVLSGLLNPVQASEKLEVVASNESKTIRMELSTPAENEINVMLLNERNRIMYSDQISAGTTFENEFDFSSFKEGTYRLVSELGTMRVNRLLEVSDSNVTFIESYVTYAPQFKMVDDKLMVKFVNTLYDNVGVSIDDNVNLIYDAFYGDPGYVFDIVYGLEEFDRGSYSIKVMVGKEIFTYDFNVEQGWM